MVILLSPPSPHDVPLGWQEPQIWLKPADVHSLDAAHEAIDFANAYGGNLDRSQEITLETCMGETVDGLWAASTFGDAESRQNGKGDSIQWRELYGATQLHERIAHTAHEVPTAKQAFMRMEGLINANPDLRRLVRPGGIKYGNGDWGIEFKTGAFIIYRTRTGTGLRGFDEIDLLVIDEAQHAQEEHLAASAPTQSISRNPQTYFAGSAGLSSSVVWWRLRMQAIRQEVGPFGWCEHTAEQVFIDERGQLVSIAPDPSNETAWAMANAAYGTRIGGGGQGSRRFFLSQLAKMGEEKFAREHLGVWDPLPSQSGPPAKFDAGKWADTATRQLVKVEPGACTLAYDVHNGWCSVSISNGSLSASHGEVIEHRKGTGWLPARLVELEQKWKPTAIGLDGGNGEAVAVLGQVREVFDDAGLDTEKLKPLTLGQYKAACGDVFDAVANGRASRPRVEPDQLQSAGEVAAERRIGESWVWDRKCSVPLSPLISWTIARSLLSERPAVEEFFAY
jgi:hypothetical protein